MIQREPRDQANQPFGCPRCIVVAMGIIWLALGALETASAQEVQTWRNQAGKEMEASLVRYDGESKTIVWRMRNGGTARSKLADLDSESKWRAIQEPPLEEEIQSRLRNFDQYVLNPKYILILTGIFVTYWLINLLINFLIFKIAIRILATPDRDWIPYLKMMVYGIVITLITLGPLAIPQVRESIIFAIMLTIGFVAISLFVSFGVIMMHYQIGFFRTLGIFLLQGVIGILINIPLSAIQEFIVVPYLKSNPQALLPLLDPLILKPLDLI